MREKYKEEEMEYIFDIEKPIPSGQVFIWCRKRYRGKKIDDTLALTDGTKEDIVKMKQAYIHLKGYEYLKQW